MNKPRVMVTGARGYIGSRLCEALQQAGHHVIAVIRQHAVGPWNETYYVDLVKDNLDPEYCQNVETIYHLAGRAHAVSDANSEDALYQSINVEGTLKLLRVAKQASVRSFVFFSSIKAMNEGGRKVYTELDECSPVTIYGKSKWQAEQEVLEGGYVAHPVVFRLPLVYGNDPKGNLRRMINSIHASRFPPIPEVHNLRSMIHVGDVVKAAMLVTGNEQARGQVYILTDGHEYSTRVIYDLIRDALGKREIRWSVPLFLLKAMAITGETVQILTGKKLPFNLDVLKKLMGSSVFSSEKITAELGFKAKHDFPAAIKQIVKSMGL